MESMCAQSFPALHDSAAPTTPGRRLIVMDIDSTLIDEEVIDLLGEEAGIGDRIASITERAMRGELDFEAALRERVSLLAGLPVSVFDAVYRRIHFTKGALELVEAAHGRGWTVGVVSGGFHEIADRLVARAGIDHMLANTLEVRDGVLTGRVVGPIVTKTVKLASMRRWAEQDGVRMDRTVAIGDGANDIPMIQAAGVGIAFCAKPRTQAAAPYALNDRDLIKALDIIDAA